MYILYAFFYRYTYGVSLAPEAAARGLAPSPETCKSRPKNFDADADESFASARRRP